MFLICIISLIIYIIATITIYHNLYNYDKNNRIKLIVLGCIVTFIITVIICNIASNGIESSNNYLNVVKNTAVLLFAPINAIISLPYVCNLFNKYKEERITKSQLKRRLILFAIILIIVLVLEAGYIKDFELGLLKGVKSEK